MYTINSDFYRLALARSVILQTTGLIYGYFEDYNTEKNSEIGTFVSHNVFES